MVKGGRKPAETAKGKEYSPGVGGEQESPFKTNLGVEAGLKACFKKW